MSRSTLETNVDSTLTTNGSSGIVAANHRALVKSIIGEALLSEDVMSENQNGDILLTNQGRGLFYGTDTAKTGNITVDLTDAITGAVAWVIHNDATEPTISSATKSNFTYNTGQTNYIKIVAQKVGGTSIALASTPLAGDSKSVTVGSGSPEGVVTALKGAFYLRTDGDQDTTTYEKVSGTGNTGWLSEADKNAFLEITDGATLTWNVRASDGTGRKKAYVTLGGNRTLAEPVSAKDGDELTLLIFQDATGFRTLAWPSNFEFKGTSEIRNDPSGYDILKAVYDETTDKFYCWFPIERGYREKLLFPTGSDVNLDMDALTTREILDYDGKTIYLNGVSAVSAGSLVELPQLSKVPYGYRLPVKIARNSASANDFEVRTSGSDTLLVSDPVYNIPILYTGGTPMYLKIPSPILGAFECELVVRNAFAPPTSPYKTWAIVNPRFSQVSYTSLGNTSTNTTIDRLTEGYKISLTATGNFTLEIPDNYEMGESVDIILTQDGTGRTITKGSGWKTAGGTWIGSTASAIYRLQATKVATSEWYGTVETIS